jgi:ribonuclease Y
MIALFIVIALVVGFLVGYILKNLLVKANLKGQLKELESQIEESNRKKRDIILEAKEEALKLKRDAEKDIKKLREEVQRYESRIAKKEDFLDKREEQLNQKYDKLEHLKKEYTDLKEEYEAKLASIDKKIEEIAEMTKQDAIDYLVSKVEKDAKYYMAQKIKEYEEQLKDDSETIAKKILSTAIQRFASDYTSEIVVSTIELPNDDMKGRIIGREGRNIKSFEKITGVDLIIDDTPEVVTLSSHDPLRREIAKQTLTKLIADGRIHPAHIEEIYRKVVEEIHALIKKYGQDAALQTNVRDIHPELIKLLGKLYFRTSFGQNVLQHSIETAFIGSMIAEELGLNANKVRRACLLHDIGKAVDHTVEGSHAIIGAELAKRYREKDDIVNMIAAHHNEVEPETPEAVIVMAADAISASRPGARKETLDLYIKRIKSLENIVKDVDNVTNAYAIQAGRELRIIVEPDKVDDVMAAKISYDVARIIEKSMEYPGQIKVSVIREKRFVDFAK